VPRRRMFLETNVVDAARARLRHVYDIGDTVCIQYSGGKDSTAVLHLAREIHEERNLGPVKVIFRDEEFLSPSIEKHINTVASYDWVDMEWYCLPQAQEVWTLGLREPVLLWDKAREEEGRLFRPVPEGAITAESFGLDPYKGIEKPIDHYTMQGKKGMTYFVTGVRAQESMIRYRSVVQKLNENYINRPYKLSKAIPMRFAKVIYDWGVNDVFKYIYDIGADYCDFYDYAALSGANQRVGIPLHSVAARRLEDVVWTEPEFYDQLLHCFPWVDAQRRLWKDFDTEKFLARYVARGWDGIRDMIDYCMLTDEFKKEAMTFAHKWKQKHATDPHSYPLDALARTLFLNEFRHTAPNPVGPKTRAHAIRMAALESEHQMDMDADSLDMQDDNR
jgi:3'-phosphoadenosine 5'-phosphosulfate sulfotransferase (PAPS reductase)/FAD synthetase